ncbi:hypothetical protein RRG08_017830 [Elysia crispata]|uniref:Uncharacterized protein n=1 Tax=Elysia crispata TaxID=231223 RepID=A0AAE1EBT9_9GAST|nr:hypothetical protein RRG08_017830 [Elysia crispata]
MCTSSFRQTQELRIILFVFICILPRVQNVTTKAAVTEIYHYQVNDEANCRKAVLSPPWTSDTNIACVRECRARFQHRCKNILYNNRALTCSPVAPNPRDDPPLVRLKPGDLLYSLQWQRVLQCDTTARFELHSYCGTAVCLLRSSFRLDYEHARADCEERGATLYMPHTAERFALLQNIAQGNT